MIAVKFDLDIHMPRLCARCQSPWFARVARRTFACQLCGYCTTEER